MEKSKEEAYFFIDKHLRALPKKPDGSINEFAEGFHNNDVDALRHAYVSGVFTQVYGEDFANVCGYLQEHTPLWGTSSPNGPEQMNMDLWNNRVGRQYGKKSKTKEELFQKLLRALKAGELIIDPMDVRKFKGDLKMREMASLVVVVGESASGANQMFYDFTRKAFLTYSEFVASIKKGVYPTYELRLIHGREVPVSKRDRSTSNNLG